MRKFPIEKLLQIKHSLINEIVQINTLLYNHDLLSPVTFVAGSGELLSSSKMLRELFD